jgi:hypothetical protein
VPSLAAPNIAGKAAVAGALARVLNEVGRPRRIGLVLPDQVAKISLIRFTQMPARAQDLDQLVRWQVRKTVPFPIEEAQVSHVPGVRDAEGHECIVSVARRAVIEEYEGLCAAAGAHAGLVDVSTFNVVNAVMSSATAPSADWLLVNVTDDYTTIAILRGADLIFYRGREADDGSGLADLVHQSAMYYEDRLRGAGFARVVLRGANHAVGADEIRRSLGQRLAATVGLLDVRESVSFADRIAASPALLDTLAPLVGLLLRDAGGAPRVTRQQKGAVA